MEIRKSKFKIISNKKKKEKILKEWKMLNRKNRRKYITFSRLKIEYCLLIHKYIFEKIPKPRYETRNEILTVKRILVKYPYEILFGCFANGTRNRTTVEIIKNMRFLFLLFFINFYNLYD